MSLFTDINGNKEPEEWWQSINHPYAIVSNYPTGHDDRSSLETYGGHLICESVRHQNTMDKILALPALLDAVEKLLAPYSQDTGRLSTPEMTALKAAYMKAKGWSKVEILKINPAPVVEPEELNEPQVEAYGIPEAPNTTIFIEDDVTVEPMTPEMFEEPKKGPLKLSNKNRIVPMAEPDYADDSEEPCELKPNVEPF